MVRSGLLGGARGTCSDTGGVMSLQGVDRPQRVRENDEETQREESSSTESTHQEVIKTSIHADMHIQYTSVFFCQCFFFKNKKNTNLTV